MRFRGKSREMKLGKPWGGQQGKDGSAKRRVSRCRSNYFGVFREYVVHQAFVARTQSRTAATHSCPKKNKITKYEDYSYCKTPRNSGFWILMSYRK